MILPGSRCLLRPWRPDDCEALVRQANDFDVARQLRDRFPHPYTHADARRFLEYACGRDGAAVNFAIEVEGQAAGGVGFSRGTDVERFAAELGYWLGRPYWGRGIATEAVATVVRHLFRDHGLLRIFAVPFADNIASIRVLEKTGFAREGLLHSGCVKYGEPRDQLLYARINGDWSAGRSIR